MAFRFCLKAFLDNKAAAGLTGNSNIRSIQYGSSGAGKRELNGLFRFRDGKTRLELSLNPGCPKWFWAEKHPLNLIWIMPAKGGLVSPNNFSSQINFLSFIGAWDWIGFIGVFVLTILAVIYGQKLKAKAQQRESEELTVIDMIIMGRQLTLPLFVATLVATWYGGIFGVTQIAFESGIFNFVTQGIFWYFAYLFFALFLVKRIREYKSITLPELCGELFGPRSKKLSAIFNFFNCVPVAYVLSMALFFQAFWGGALWQNAIIGVVLIGSYSLFGGLRSDVFSDFVQFFVMCFSVALIAVASYTTFGGLDFLQAHLPSQHFEPLGGHTWGQTLVWGCIALVTLVDPNFYQRVFAAKTAATAKKGILISTLIWILFDICTTVGGLYARAIIPNADSGLAYLTYGLQLLPEGWRGFFLAGIFATIASTLDSFLIIASSSLSFDLGPAYFRTKTWWTRLHIIFVGCLSIFLAQFFTGGIKQVWKTFGSYAAACLLLPMLFVLLTRRKLTDWQFVFSSLTSAVMVTLWRFSERSGIWAEIDEVYIGLFTSAWVLILSWLLIGLISKRTSP